MAVRQQLTQQYLPLVPTMVYPPDPSFLVGNLMTARLHVGDFWGVPDPTGPGAIPGPNGSVKSVKVVQDGICSQDLAYVTADQTGLLDQIGDGAYGGFRDLVARGEAGGVGCTKRYWSNVVPYLHQSAAREDADGGFFFRFAYEFNANVVASTAVIFEYNVAYRWRLLDGIVDVDPIFSDDSYRDGTGRQAIEQAVTDLLLKANDETVHQSDLINPAPMTLAKEVHDIAAEKQRLYSFVPSNDPKDPYKYAMTCDPIETHPQPGFHDVLDDRVPSQPPSGANLCQGFVMQMENFVQGAYGVVTPPLSSLEQQRVIQTITEVDSDGYYKHFRCAHREGPPLPNGKGGDLTVTPDRAGINAIRRSFAAA